MAPLDAKDDLQLTPAERAAAMAAEAAAQSGEGPAKAEAKGAADHERLFAEAPEMTIGEDGNTMVVIGAGLVGALAAVVLLRKGFKVHLFERYPDIRSIPSTGRSINLSVTSRGLRSVRALGGSLHDDLMKLATRITGRIIHLPDGKVVFQRYGKDDSECNYSVSRIDLNKFLIEAAETEGATLHFDHNMSETSDFVTGEVGCTLNFVQGPPNKPEELKYLKVKVMCPIIACDGGGSRVRYALKRAGVLEFSEDLLSRGYKEVLFPKPEGEGFGCKGDSGSEPCDGRFGLHIWPRGDHMLMALANRDGSFTGTIYMDSHGENESFASFDDTEEGRTRCRAFCEKYYSHAAPHVGGMDQLVRQITSNPNGLLGTVHATRWAYKSKVVLIGDACHAMVPFFGQGCNCGFEDTLWLSRLLDKHCGDGSQVLQEKCTPENFATCFAELEKERKPNADAICDMALENFVEMRDKTGDIKFQTMKKIENKLENLFGAKFRSRYAMVCYGGEGNVSYANAKELGLIQWDILDRLCEGIGDLSTDELVQAAIEKVDVAQAEKLIDELLVPRQKELSIDLSTVKH
eukprot:gnl/TRDRNA2_/TRDRNA2_198667_c0_seq1.p1 gnl/TRDRNA2_/TRDRNA2_198667_c0~~gnl/TRDRNA2_/TRDRNA2_198667_c0_seq1.p1  ORF type:complete len:576 (+),score=139.18 gnl/TRDRNA2_/TRDRNA2_198667_c0_seq1:96-1823(+)